MTPGRVIGFDRYVRESAGSLDYPAVTRNWKECAAPADVIVRPYDPAADTVADFSAVAGLERPLESPATRVNATPGYTAHALMKIVDDQYAGPHMAGELLELLAGAGLLGREFHAVDPCLIDLPDAELERIADEFDVRNASLRTEYGIEVPRAPLTGLHGRRHMTHPVNTDLIAAVIEIILHERRERRRSETMHREEKARMQAEIDGLKARFVELESKLAVAQ